MAAAGDLLRFNGAVERDPAIGLRSG